MFCPKCGNKLPKKATVCSWCGTDITEDVKDYKIQTKKPQLWLSITSMILSVVMFVFSTILTLKTNAMSAPEASDAVTVSKISQETTGEKQYETGKINKTPPDIFSISNLTPDPDGARKASQEISVIEDAIAIAESAISTPGTPIAPEDVYEYIRAVTYAMRDLYYADQIKYYRVNDTCITIELNCGGTYLYAPTIDGYDSGSSPDLKIATYQPYYTSGQYDRVPAVRPYADDAATMIDNAFDAYTFLNGGANDHNFNDAEVDPIACANFGAYNVILWHGHGCFDSYYGPLMCLGVPRNPDNDSKYRSILASGTLIYSKNTYYIGSDFINYYVQDGSLDNTIIYVGVCEGGYTSELANAFLAKGAKAVYAPDETVLTVYNANMLRSVCEGLTKRNYDGSYYTVTQALDYAKTCNGSTDGGRYNAEIELFTNDSTFSLDWYEDYVVSDRDIVLVLDVSGSMGGTPLNETKKAAVNFVNTVLAENARIGVVAYDNSAILVNDFSNREIVLTTKIDSLYTGGQTNTDAALQMAEQMLDNSQSSKKIIVLMSDGIPNIGRQGDSLVNYANIIKDKGVYIYTLGFFSDLAGYEKADAQELMRRIASPGLHYEVDDADNLVYFFNDVADMIGGQKYIYIQIACPVNVRVSRAGEVLDSSDRALSTRTSFGTLTFEENKEDSSNDGNSNVDNRIKVLRLKDGMEYNIEIEGTGKGYMDYVVQYMDENGNYTDKREFNNIKVSRSMQAVTVAGSTRDKTVLSVDEDGDGKYDIVYEAAKNQKAQEASNIIHYIWLGVLIFSAAWVIASVILMVIQIKKRIKATAAINSIKAATIM